MIPWFLLEHMPVVRKLSVLALESSVDDHIKDSSNNSDFKHLNNQISQTVIMIHSRVSIGRTKIEIEYLNHKSFK